MAPAAVPYVDTVVPYDAVERLAPVVTSCAAVLPPTLASPFVRNPTGSTSAVSLFFGVTDTAGDFISIASLGASGYDGNGWRQS